MKIYSTKGIILQFSAQYLFYFLFFSINLIISGLIIAIGLTNSLVDLTLIICFFIWLWLISPIYKLSKKEREEKYKRKVEAVKAFEKTIEAYENKFKSNTYYLHN